MGGETPAKFKAVDEQEDLVDVARPGSEENPSCVHQEEVSDSATRLPTGTDLLVCGIR
jgi:hypothetical protein